MGIPGVLLGLGVGNFIAGFYFLKDLKLKVNSFSHLKKNFKFLMHNFAVELSQGLTRWIDKLLIVPLFGFAFVGIYHFNIQILFLLSLLPISLHSFLLSEEASGKVHNKLNYIVILGSVFLVLLVVIFSSYFIPQFFPNYIEGIPSLQILIISLLPLTITAIFNAKLQAKYSTKVGFPSIARIGSLLILLFFLGSSYGLEGLAFAVLISACIESITLAILYRRSLSSQ